MTFAEWMMPSSSFHGEYWSPYFVSKAVTFCNIFLWTVIHKPQQYIWQYSRVIWAEKNDKSNMNIFDRGCFWQWIIRGHWGPESGCPRHLCLLSQQCNDDGWMFMSINSLLASSFAFVCWCLCHWTLFVVSWLFSHIFRSGRRSIIIPASKIGRPNRSSTTLNNVKLREAILKRKIHFMRKKS